MRQWNATAFCHLIRQKKFLFFWTRPTIDDRLTDIDDVSFDRQSKILSCLKAFLIVINRCRVSVSSVIHHHPLVRCFERLLLSFFQLGKVILQLFDPQKRKLSSPASARVHDLLDSEISRLLQKEGLTQVIGPLEHQLSATKHTMQLQLVQAFLTQQHECVFNIIGAVRFK